MALCGGECDKTYPPTAFKRVPAPGKPTPPD